MYTPTTLGASRQAEAFSHELVAWVRKRRAQDPTLGLLDVLAGFELAKASLLAESGVAGTRARILAIAVALLVAGVGAAFFFLAPVS